MVEKKPNRFKCHGILSQRASLVTQDVFHLVMTQNVGPRGQNRSNNAKLLTCPKSSSNTDVRTTTRRAVNYVERQIV